MNAKLAAAAFAAIIAANPFLASAQTISSYDTGEKFAGPFPSWKSVKDFGAKGDGSTDDAAAIGKVLKALKYTNAKTRNVLYFPAGAYMIGQASSTFEYGAGSRKSGALGNVALRTGVKIDWDPVNMRARNTPKADRFIKGEYRKPWEIT